jgi:hypothetical protein
MTERAENPLVEAICRMDTAFWNLPADSDDAFLLGRLKADVQEAYTRYLNERTRRGLAA